MMLFPFENHKVIKKTGIATYKLTCCIIWNENDSTFIGVKKYNYAFSILKNVRIFELSYSPKMSNT